MFVIILNYKPGSTPLDWIVRSVYPWDLAEPKDVLDLYIPETGILYSKKCLDMSFIDNI